MSDATWVDNPRNGFSVGDIGFLVSRSRVEPDIAMVPPVRWALYSRPVHRGSHPILWGVAGQQDGETLRAHGLATVLRLGGNERRCQVAALTDRDAIARYLSRQGYPHLVQGA